MKTFFTLMLSFIALFAFQHNASCSILTDTITTRPLLLNEACLVGDASNMSERKSIYDAAAYARMQAWSSCSADSFPDVDFNKYLLLWVSYSYSGCTRDVDRIMKCVVDHNNKKVFLQLVVHQKGPCRPNYLASELFPIPAVPEYYTIELFLPGRQPIIIHGKDY